MGQKGNQQMDELKRQSDINQSVGQKENQHIDWWKENKAETKAWDKRGKNKLMKKQKDKNHSEAQKREPTNGWYDNKTKLKAMMRD